MDSIPMLLITANVGSIFDDPTNMFKLWTTELFSKISSVDVKFIALHCQELGGKNYENSMKHVEHFIKLLLASDELKQFNKVRMFLDEDYNSVRHFTALGSFYFIHNSIDNVLIWDFEESKFTPVSDKLVYSGNIESVATKEKAKFPQNFFPECKWSRKGYMRTRWSLFGTIFDLINIHLFHDASNLVAMSTYPSVYCKNRRYALQHTLQRFHDDNYDNAPYFVFGDLNFRTDTGGVIKKLTDGLTKTRIQNTRNNDHTKLHFTNEENNLVLCIGKKEFSHSDHKRIFLNYDWLKSFDKETEAFKSTLTEFPVTFAPSYPFEEDISKANSYMVTRCPAWCDRVLLSYSAKEIVKESSTVDYGLLGLNTCMGDHKPVFLKFNLKGNAGTVSCCDHASFICLPDACRCCRTLDTIRINVIDTSDYITTKPFTDTPIDSNYLHPATKGQFLLEPYTPESSTSRSEENETVDIQEQRKRCLFSPAQLKNKLENILMSNNMSSVVQQPLERGEFSSDESGFDSSQVLVSGKSDNADFSGDLGNRTAQLSLLKTRKSSVISNIEYKRFSFIRFRKRSKKKRLSCVEAICVIA